MTVLGELELNFKGNRLVEWIKTRFFSQVIQDTKKGEQSCHRIEKGRLWDKKEEEEEEE